MAERTHNPRELQSVHGSVGTPSPVNPTAVQNYYALERLDTEGPADIPIYDITSQVVSQPLNPVEDIFHVQEESQGELRPPAQDHCDEVTQLLTKAVSQPPSSAAQRQPRKQPSKSKTKALQGAQPAPAKIVQTHRTEIAPKSLHTAAKSPKAQAKRPRAALLSQTSKAQPTTSPTRIANRAGA